VLTLTQCETSSTGGGGAGKVPPATRESPFVNSLGMKFVPVPGTKVLFCTTETTVAQYQAAGLGYQAPEFSQGGNHPAVNVSWNDAKAWCAWLSKKEGRKYRLPTDAEWSAAVGGSTYPWGNQWPPPNNVGNYAGQEMRGCTPAERAILFKGFTLIGGFTDRHKFTAPVGSYPANGYGLYDMGGNVWEWCEDKHPTVSGTRVLRGGSWVYAFRDLLASSFRGGPAPYDRYNFYGFRVVVVR
jgi:formylglycine-generating enzyme required for sulfatase activity